MSFNTRINSNYAIFNLVWHTLNSDISLRQIQLLYDTQTNDQSFQYVNGHELFIGPSK